MGPASVSACAMADLMLAKSVTSSATTCAAPPSASISARNSFRRSVRREASTTWAPACASTFAKRAPRPLDAPVIRAILPSKLTSMPTSYSCFVLDNTLHTVHGKTAKTRTPQLGISKQHDYTKCPDLDCSVGDCHAKWRQSCNPRQKQAHSCLNFLRRCSINQFSHYKTRP